MDRLKTPSFKFIRNPEFRTSLESDYQELVACFDTKAWKAVHVLAGSIVEALLVDTLIAEEVVNDKKGLILDLGRAIELCLEHQIISERTRQLSAVIKSYRNLIHPGRIIRLDEKIDADTATVAMALVNIIQEEIEASRTDKYGYTAEQILQKVVRDPSARAILPHLLKQTNEVELSRLLSGMIADEYFRVWEPWDTLGVDVDPKSDISATMLMDSLIILYQQAFEHSPEFVRTQAITYFAKIIREEREAVVVEYGNAFFRAQYLLWASDDDRLLLKSHLLGRVEVGVDDNTAKVVSGIGTFLETEDMDKFVDPLVMNLSSTVLHSRSIAEELLQNEYEHVPGEYSSVYKECVENWKWYYHQENRVGPLKVLEGIISYWEIPF